MRRRIGTVAALAALWAAMLPGSTQAAEVNYEQTAACAYFVSSDGWASVGRAPRGTVRVVYTMRTGTPGAWGATDITATTKARKWRVVTGRGMSFINWVKFYDASNNELAAQNVNVRCAGTDPTWPR
jgi:hypothetical protein